MRGLVAGAAFVAVVVLTSAAAVADGTPATRERAAQETREALQAYRRALEAEVRELESWVRRNAGDDGFRDEGEAATKRLRELADEAGRAWDSVRARMDAVVDDLRDDYPASSVRTPSR
jgi:hypothetical protein